ncbi:MAG: hypothetical protein ABR543_12580 [Gemmatimonadaceae bacterium]
MRGVLRNSRSGKRAAVGRGAICCFTLASVLFLAPAPTRAQQRIDSAFHPTIAQPEYPAGERPLVLVDRAHHNFHAGAGQFEQFARLLRGDGYRVRGLEERFSAKALAGAVVLVIVNAVASREDKEWSLPTSRAFTTDEVEAVRQWVERGGSLLLIADHMPFPGAMDALARVFGIEFLNGFAIVWQDWDPLMFHRADASLPSHPVTDGRRPGERVEHAVTFVSGSAFRALKSARCVSPLLVLGHGVVSYQPERAWQFTDATPRVPVEGWLQGATLEPGRGRVAVFGEAAMFAAQLTGAKGDLVGMNSPQASYNLQLLFNTLHWLSRAPGYGPAATRRC